MTTHPTCPPYQPTIYPISKHHPYTNRKLEAELSTKQMKDSAIDPSIDPLTEQSLQFNVAADEVVEPDMSLLVTVPHHDRIERRVAHTETYAHQQGAGTQSLNLIQT